MKNSNNARYSRVSFTLTVHDSNAQNGDSAKSHFWSLVLISGVILKSLELTNLRESKKNYVDNIGQVSFQRCEHCWNEKDYAGRMQNAYACAEHINLYTYQHILYPLDGFFNICWLQWLIMTHKKHLSSGDIQSVLLLGLLVQMGLLRIYNY